MTKNQYKAAEEFDSVIRSSPRKLGSSSKISTLEQRTSPKKLESPFRINISEQQSSPKKLGSPFKMKTFEQRSSPRKTSNVLNINKLHNGLQKTINNSEKISVRNENKLNDKELLSCLDSIEKSDNSDFSDDNEDSFMLGKASLHKKEAQLWRVATSPITKSLKHCVVSCEKTKTSKRERTMSPAKPEQLNKAKRSLNLEICAEIENKQTNCKSPLKLTLKRKIVDADGNKDVSPAKSVRISTKYPTSPVTMESPSTERSLRAREEIKLPLWRRDVDPTPLVEIQTKKNDSPRSYHTPKKTILETATTTPKSNKRVSFGTPVSTVPSKTFGTPVSRKSLGRGFLTPTMAEKQKSNRVNTPQEPLDQARVQLHISTVPMSLPCREKEFNNIKGFLKRKIDDHAGGCMYISGVPGTGKTATVHAVVRSLQQAADADEIRSFDFVEVNGLRLTEPRQAYVRILQTLNGEKLTPEQAQRILEKKFSGSTKKSTVLLVDELDYLCNRRQDVVYNILDWPSKRNSGLIVLTISNTMDLPERTLKGRVTSRMGLTRLMFQPYSHHQLQEIVLDRLAGNKSFHPDAVQLVARKVAAVSGDARRALDICRRATELVSGKNTVTVSHVESALTQIFTGPRVMAIRSCCKLEQLVLRALRDETQRTGVDESNVRQVYYHLVNICSLEDVPTPHVGEILRTCAMLASLGLIVAEKGRPDIMRKLSLNVSSDDIHYALDC